MKTYEDLLRKVLTEGSYREERTGTGAFSLFGEQLQFDLRDSTLPVVTTKKVHLKSVIYELLWMLRGRADVKWLQDRGVSIWDEWQLEDGTIGPGYGEQWRSWRGFNGLFYDQIAQAQHTIMSNPSSRRNVVSAWNVAEIQDMALPPCHCLFQFFVDGDELSCQLYQRSADIFLGVPFNITSYALLTHMMAAATGLKAHKFVHTFGDVHLYENHVEQAREQLSRKPYDEPQVRINGEKYIWDYDYDDITIIGYQSHPAIKAPVAV